MPEETLLGLCLGIKNKCVGIKIFALFMMKIVGKSECFNYLYSVLKHEWGAAAIAEAITPITIISNRP